ncbi:hypothetical protein DH2020_048513 [Rehmannia glutinosa]|uniref:Protein kinase domain-containing protein n=1 Tax=Rehmannia glutinosa TaxID=99300 RepID=A0ABR0U5H8_REHGL
MLKNRTVLRSELRKYNVEALNYNNFTIRLSDPGLDSQNRSSCPRYSSTINDIYLSYMTFIYTNSITVTFLNCLSPVVNNPLYIHNPFCGNTSAFPSSSRVYSYVTVGTILVEELEEECTFDTMVVATASSSGKDSYNYSYTEVHDMMAYGIEVSWYRVMCDECYESDGDCVLGDGDDEIRCRHSSMQQSEIIQELSQHQVTNFMPINYTYGEIKKMTNNFKTKLGGENVFKGKLQSGPYVSIKMLTNCDDDHKEFISCVSKISSIRHPNVAKLVGFCIENTKRALVHEFSHRGSLEKHVFSHVNDIFKISIGIARGIEFLHGVRIFRLGIRPQNVLLDEEFNPKIMLYYGIAKMGIIAPEMFYKNVGEVSCKVDVYRFGMLVLEMLARVKYGNYILREIYFPFWIYSQLSEGKELEIMDATNEEKMMVKKMVFVALWCIQIRPRDRPFMSEVIGMLEGGFELLDLPPKPFMRKMDDEIMDKFF